jgi:hypothetical protein
LGPFGIILIGAERKESILTLNIDDKKKQKKSVENLKAAEEKPGTAFNSQNESDFLNKHLTVSLENHSLKELDDDSTITFDCWKQILHDMSDEPSNGKYLKDVASDSKIKEVFV